jgi:hypothetical protein
MAIQLLSRWQQVGFFCRAKEICDLYHFREFVMEWQAIAMTKLYNIIRVLPRWVLYIVSGVLGSFVMKFIHRGGMKNTAKTIPVPPVKAQSTATGLSTAVIPSATSTTPAKGKGKRGKK